MQKEGEKLDCLYLTHFIMHKYNIKEIQEWVIQDYIWRRDTSQGIFDPETLQLREENTKVTLL